MAIPELNYNYFEYNVQGEDATPHKVVLNHLPVDELIKVSFQDGYSQLKLKYTPNIALIYYEIRITEADADFGIGVGTKWYQNGPNIAGSTEQTVILPINSTYFSSKELSGADKVYRIGLYAKSADSEGIWDVTYLFLTTENDGEHKIYTPTGNDGLTVLTNEPIPSN